MSTDRGVERGTLALSPTRILRDRAGPKSGDVSSGYWAILYPATTDPRYAHLRSALISSPNSGVLDVANEALGSVEGALCRAVSPTWFAPSSFFLAAFCHPVATAEWRLGENVDTWDIG
jgi:hypothetical protein